jgi:nitrate/nitrite transport system ATP-binding protein
MIARIDPKTTHNQQTPMRAGRPFLNIDHVDKTFVRGGVETEVLKNISLGIDKGEFIAIIGHSGCGKSTLLNLIAGLTPVTSGAVLLEDMEVNAPGPERAVVFQNHSLLPWLTVFENVQLAVDKVFASSRSKAERHDWTMHNLGLVQMTHAKDKRPSEISGGMKQRVGIARALAMEPKVLLMDEPFGALDALTRAHLQDTVMQIHSRLGNTAIMITHDVDEAVLLSDRVVMMTNGPAARIGEILEVGLARPRHRLDLVSDAGYIRARESVLKFLYERHRFVEAAA